MTQTREQVLSALEKACDFDVCTMGITVQLDEQQLMRFASEMAAAGQQAEREKLLLLAYMDEKSGEVCSATWLNLHARECDQDRFTVPLYIREEQ